MQRDFSQLGNELKKEREARHLELKAIADRTKISLSYLESIEAGVFNFLPDPYPRHFLKIYLDQMGTNLGHYLTHFDEIKRPKVVIPVTPVIEEKKVKNIKPAPNSDFSNYLKNFREKHSSIFVTGIILFVLLILIFILNNQNGTEATDKTGIEQTIIQQESHRANLSPFRFIKKELLNLKIVATDKTWIQLIIDDSTSLEYILKSGDSNVWQAKNKFIVRIGNGAGVKLYFNGNDLGDLGKTMEVINLSLSKEGIERKKL